MTQYIVDCDKIHSPYEQNMYGSLEFYLVSSSYKHF